jgi:uncharacterized protein (TIGR02391 family)
MTSSLYDKLPPEDILLGLQPEELAMNVLACLCSDGSPKFHRLNFFNGLKNYKDPAVYAIAEAWSFLEQEGLIAEEPYDTNHWMFVTRRGQKIFKSGNFKQYKALKALPKELLDAILASKVIPPLMRGDYDSAIFEAFKEVEIRVRPLSELSDSDLGVNLMRKAFHPENGPLTDSTQLQSEKQVISDLFAGAIGSFKNPSSHRDIDFDDIEEVIKLILLADHLIKISERRKK